MDQMLPSPGFSIPSLTPFQQLEEDQQIIANNPYYAHTGTTGLTPVGMGSGNNANNGVGSSGLNPNIESTTTASFSNVSSMPPLMSTPGKGSSYQPSYAPQSLMQPQTPVRYIKLLYFV